MGKKLKRGQAGNAVQYLTRTKAIRKLQLRLGEFRRLCILKGIHPREPKKHPKGANKTYYHIKDVNFLLHEPLLATFRNLKVHDRKIRKAKAKHNEDLAQRLRTLKPGYKVDHLVKERYPSFIDAVRDLDDPLTMVNLFAMLPAEKKYEIPIKAVQMARRLSMEFNAYVVRTNALRKVFVSIKGFYYQAEILGQTVTWLVPHQLAQVLPVDVDYRVMLTFLEFYETMLQFVNFKLYNMLTLRYPPSLDKRLEDASEDLAAIMKDLAGVKEAVDDQIREQQKQIQQLEMEEASNRKGGQQSEEEEEDSEEEAVAVDIDSDGDDDDDDDDESEDQGDNGKGDDVAEDEVLAMISDRRRRESAALRASTSNAKSAEDEDGEDDDDGEDGERAAGGTLGVDADDEASVCGALFKGLVFYLAREIPREPLLFVIRAFGGSVAWSGEGSPIQEGDERITHQVVDRPTQGHRFLSRKYVQPQWVIDSANFRVLMPSELYVPGKVPPPHLSPFVNNDEEGYTPDFAETVKRLQDAAKAARVRASGIAAKSGDAAFVGDEGEEAEQRLALESKAEDAEAVEKAYLADMTKELRAASGIESEDPDDGDEDEGDEQDENITKAASGLPSKKRPAAADTDLDDAERMKDIMMTRKNRKFYERIKRAQAGKQERVEVLETRKRAVQEKEKQAPSAVSTPKQSSGVARRR